MDNKQSNWIRDSYYLIQFDCLLSTISLLSKWIPIRFPSIQNRIHKRKLKSRFSWQILINLPILLFEYWLVPCHPLESSKKSTLPICNFVNKMRSEFSLLKKYSHHELQHFYIQKMEILFNTRDCLKFKIVIWLWSGHNFSIIFN